MLCLFDSLFNDLKLCLSDSSDQDDELTVRILRVLNLLLVVDPNDGRRAKRALFPVNGGARDGLHT